MVEEKEKVIPMHSVNISNNHTLRVIRAHHNRRITTIEKILGAGNTKHGAGIMKKLLNNLSKAGFSSATIGKILDKDRHVIHKWYRRYGLRTLPYKGDRPSLLKITLSRDEHNVKYYRYEWITSKLYKVYYVYLNSLFAYIIGLILGDGNVDSRKLYIVGGKPFDFLDVIHTKVIIFGKYLGNRAVKVKYYDKEDNKLDRGDPDVTSWRLYIYWSALSHALKNKEVLIEILEKIWSIPKLFDAFTSGLFDADGYFTLRHKKPERIGLDQTTNKWWFFLFYEKLKQRYLAKMTKRVRKYKIKRHNKIYQGVAEFNIITLRMASWADFVDNVVLPHCKKPIHLKRALKFKSHAIKMRNRWRFK